MFISKKGKISLIILSILYLLALSSCATTPHKAEDLEESLRKTAIEYWKLRMADKYEETYKMEHREDLPPYPEYLNKVMLIKKFTIVGHNIKDIKVEGNKGSVEVEFSFILPPVTKPFIQAIRDEWLFEKGRWLHKLPK